MIFFEYIFYSVFYRIFNDIYLFLFANIFIYIFWIRFIYSFFCACFYDIYLFDFLSIKISVFYHHKISYLFIPKNRLYFLLRFLPKTASGPYFSRIARVFQGFCANVFLPLDTKKAFSSFPLPAPFLQGQMLQNCYKPTRCLFLIFLGLFCRIFIFSIFPKNRKPLFFKASRVLMKNMVKILPNLTLYKGISPCYDSYCQRGDIPLGQGALPPWMYRKAAPFPDG